MRTKIERLYDEVCQYDNLTFKDNIENRLNKVLSKYISDLDDASDRVLGKKISTVYKELNRYGD